MHHIKKQQSLFGFVLFATVIFVDGSQKSNSALPTRKRLHGDRFARDMQRTVWGAQEQKKADADHPIHQSPEHLARIVRKHHFDSSNMNSDSSEESCSSASQGFMQSGKENKK